MSPQFVDMSWIAAVVAPWTVSPHPNFSGGVVTAPQGLALVTERRDRAGANDDRHLEASWPDWGSEVVENARLSLGPETQRQATERLWELSLHSDLTVGSRIAAATYAALGSLELDEASAAVDKLGSLLADLKGDGEPGDFGPSFRLAIGVLAQQRVVRAQDSARFDDARNGVSEVLRWLPRVSSTGFEDFPLSRGISWSASRVQKDILVAAKQNALASRAQLEQFAGDTWVRVVRARSGWIDLRHYLLERNRDAAVLRDDFETKFDSTAGKRILMRESASDVAYAALLAAELSGDAGRARSSRAELAKIHLLDSGNKLYQTREALRLLRQSDATEPLKSALSWIRAEGPLEALRDDALVVIDRALRDRYASESDLLVLDNAADLLSATDLAGAIEVAEIYLETQERIGHVAWSQLDNVWKSITRFVPGSGQDNLVAGQAADLLDNPAVLSRPLTTTLARLVAELEWSDVEKGNRDRWTRWAEIQSGSNSETEALLFELSNALLAPPVSSDTRSDLEAAAILADDGLPDGADDSALDAAREAIVTALRAESESAKNRAYSFGGIAPSNVGVAFALRFGDRQLWEAVADHLLDSNVISSHKELALDRLAMNARDVPKAVRKRLGDRWRVIADSRRDSWMGGESLPVFPEAIRMAASFGALSPTEGVEAIVQLAAGGDLGRIEAAKSMPYVIERGDATWGHVLLLQLAKDSNPNVRAEAGFAMIRLSGSESSVSEMVLERARTLLHSDGIRCALRILHGLQSMAESQPALVKPWLSDALELARSDQRRVIRGAAEEVLRIARANSPE